MAEAAELSPWPASALDPSGVLPSTDGVTLSYYELPTGSGARAPSGRPLLLVHATGFCGPMLAPLARHLDGDWRALAIDQRGHGRSTAPQSRGYDWEGFADDVLAAVDHLGLEGAVGFGHSCGGAALLLAEERRPGTFAGLYCFEPVVFPGDEPPAAAMRDNPMSVGALRRRNSFPSREAALANFSSKAPFDVLAPDVLAAYVDNGLEPGPDGQLHLRCRREDEAQIYAMGMLHHAFARLQQVKCPVTLAFGSETDAFGPDLVQLMSERLPWSEKVVFDGLGHFGPLQDPARVAASLSSSSAAVNGTVAGDTSAKGVTPPS